MGNNAFTEGLNEMIYNGKKQLCIYLFTKLRQVNKIIGLFIISFNVYYNLLYTRM